MSSVLTSPGQTHLNIDENDKTSGQSTIEIVSVGATTNKFAEILKFFSHN